MEHALKTYRTNHHLTLSDIEKVTGIGKSLLSKYERWQAMPRRDHLMSIIRATNGAVTANDFLPAASAAGSAEAPLQPPYEIASAELIQGAAE